MKLVYKKMNHYCVVFALLIGMFVLGACSNKAALTKDDSVDYRSATQIPSLHIDLNAENVSQSRAEDKPKHLKPAKFPKPLIATPLESKKMQQQSVQTK